MFSWIPTLGRTPATCFGKGVRWLALSKLPVGNQAYADCSWVRGPQHRFHASVGVHAERVEEKSSKETSQHKVSDYS